MRKAIHHGTIATLVMVLAACSSNGAGGADVGDNDSTYTVTYDSNDADRGTAPETVLYEVGRTVTAAENVGGLERAGFPFFVGWNTESDGSGDGYRPGQTFRMPAADVTLYADWIDVGIARAGTSREDDAFGRAVAVSGNYMIVGAPQFDGAGESSGAAYIFRRSGREWVLDTTLEPDDVTTSSRFGYSVAINGDYAVVGSPDETAGQGRYGSAYIYERTALGWTYRDTVDERSDADEPDGFGRGFGAAIVIEGDYAFIGAPGVDDHPNPGAVYVLQRQTSGWERIARLTSGGPNGGFFGEHLAVDDDTLIVGARQTGAYAFYRSPDGWSRSTKGDAFPQDTNFPISVGGPINVESVAVSGDYAVVGAILAIDIGAAGRAGDGIAALFRRGAGGWERVGELTPEAGVGRDYYSYAVAMHGDYAVVSARQDDDAGRDSGAAFVFRRDGSEWGQFTALYSPNAAPADEFGSVIAIDAEHLVIGSPWDNESASEPSRGAAFSWRYR